MGLLVICNSQLLGKSTFLFYFVSKESVAFLSEMALATVTHALVISKLAYSHSLSMGLPQKNI